MFNMTETGFHVTFKNGYKLSVQWGEGNYCSNRRSVLESFTSCNGLQLHESRTAEIAAFRPDDTYLHLGDYDDVVGWLSADEVADYIAIISGPNPESACKPIPTIDSAA